MYFFKAGVVQFKSGVKNKHWASIVAITLDDTTGNSENKKEGPKQSKTDPKQFQNDREQNENNAKRPKILKLRWSYV